VSSPPKFEGAGTRPERLEVVSAPLPTNHGNAISYCFRSTRSGASEHLAVVWGRPSAQIPLVRVHSECLTGDVAGSLRCDCGWQLARSRELLAESGFGILIYMRGHEGRGIGLFNKMRAYERQSRLGEDTVDANSSLGLPVDDRSFSDAADFLHWIKVDKADLLTNNPEKIAALEHHGVVINQRVPLSSPENPFATQYIATKQTRLNHFS
jgi:3,4-dihydroxy 2-butanone 4-phosphate synthase/GTP cyclohydrolase II